MNATIADIWACGYGLLGLSYAAAMRGDWAEAIVGTLVSCGLLTLGDSRERGGA